MLYPRLDQQCDIGRSVAPFLTSRSLIAPTLKKRFYWTPLHALQPSSFHAIWSSSRSTNRNTRTIVAVDYTEVAQSPKEDHGDDVQATPLLATTQQPLEEINWIQ